MINYELKDLTFDGISKNKDGGFSIRTSVMIKAAGEEERIAKTERLVIDLDRNMTLAEAELTCIAAAQEFIKEKYPNT